MQMIPIHPVTLEEWLTSAVIVLCVAILILWIDWIAHQDDRS